MSEPLDHIQDQADAFLHGLLPVAEEARVRSHCETCPTCKQAVEEARKRLAVMQAVPPTEAPPQLVETTMRHIQETQRRRTRRKKWMLASFVGVSAVAACVLLSVQLYTQNMKVSPYDLAIFGQSDLLAATTASLRVRLVDRSTNRPVSGVPVTVELAEESRAVEPFTVAVLDRFTTDAQGSGEPRFELPDLSGQYLLRVRAQTLSGEEIVTHAVELHRSWKVMVSTDKPVYQPGQTIHVRTLALRALDQMPAKEVPTLFTLTDPKGNLLFKQEGRTSKFGIAAMDCQLATEILEGTYTLSCKIGDTESRRAVEVKKYVLPKFKVEVKLDRPYYRPKDKAKVVVQADYFFGKPVADSEVIVEVWQSSNDKPLHEEKLRTDAKGHAEFEYTIPTVSDQTPLLFKANVTDTAGQKQSQTVERSVTEYPVRIDLVPENGSLVQDVPNTVYVLTTRVDGLPMSLRVKVAAFDEIRTDALGVGSFVVTPTSNSVKWRVTARDEGGELLASRSVPVDCGATRGDFLLRTDKVVYRAGDTMQLSVRGLGQQPVYVDVVKEGQTLLTRAIEMKLGVGTASVDLPPDLYGTLQLCAYRFVDERMTAQRTRVVYVHPPGELKIQTTLDHDEYRPRGEAKINFRVTDAKGGAAPGVLSIAAVDEAVFSVLPQRPGREMHFYTVDDQLLAPAYKLRSWSPETPSGDEAMQRLQQAIFAATASSEAVRTHYDRQLSSLSLHSINEDTYPRKVENLEVMQERRLEWIGLLWWALLIFTVLLAYVSGWIIFAPAAMVRFHVFFVLIVMVAIPMAIYFLSFGAKSPLPGEAGLAIPDLQSRHFEGTRIPFGIRLTARNQSYLEALAKVESLVQTELSALPVRDYFPETLAWQPQLVTDDDGRASLDLDLADSITTWRLSASAVTADGRLGATEKPLKVFQPFFVDVNLPVSLTRGDELAVPIVVYNYLDKPQTVALSLTKSPWFTLLDDADKRVELAAGQVRSISYRLRVEKAGEQELTISARAGEVGDAVKRLIEVVPDGRRVEVVHNGTLAADAVHELTLPKNAIDGSGRAFVKIYPSGFSEVVEGLDGIFRLPHGCFEQTSSTTYPNVLALHYLQNTKQTAPAVEKKARRYIHLGYQRLLSFEVSGGGFDWFGHAPANVQLTAYGLMEFQDMARVHAVDPTLVERTRAWLLKQRRDDGSWLPDGLGHFDADQLRLTAYVAWAVFDGDHAADKRDLTRKFLLQHSADKIDDPYLLALMCNALWALDPSGRDATAYVDRLDALKRMEKNVQQASWTLAKNGRTLYHGWGESGTVETTALAALALIRDGRYPTTVRLALAWLAAHKDSQGTWGSTQATVLSLKALLVGTHSFGGDKERRFVIRLGDTFTQELVVPANQADVLQLVDLSKYLTSEPQRLTIRETSGTKSAYQVAFRYHEPLTLLAAEDRPLKIEMKFDKETAKVGDTIAATATVTNRTGQAAPMVMLELPIPLGFALADDDFAQLVEKKVIAKYERTPRGVLVYLTELGQDLTLTYHLQATTPARGTTTPARVYEYYNPQQEGRSEQVLLAVREK